MEDGESMKHRMEDGLPW